METKYKDDEVITEMTTKQEGGLGQSQSSPVCSSLSSVGDVLKAGSTKYSKVPSYFFIFIMKMFWKDQRLSRKYCIVPMFQSPPRWRDSPSSDHGQPCFDQGWTSNPGRTSLCIQNYDRWWGMKLLGTGALTSQGLAGANTPPQRAKGVRKQKSRPKHRKPGCKEQTGTDPQGKAGVSIHVATEGQEGTVPAITDLKRALLLLAAGPWDWLLCPWDKYSFT